MEMNHILCLNVKVWLIYRICISLIFSAKFLIKVLIMLLYKPSLTMYIWSISKQEYWHDFLLRHSHSNQKCSEKLDLLIQFNFHCWILVFFITKIISVNLHIIFKNVCEIWNNLLYVIFVDTVIINYITDIIRCYMFSRSLFVLFSSPGQRPCELLPSGFVHRRRRPS